MIRSVGYLTYTATGEPVQDHTFMLDGETYVDKSNCLFLFQLGEDRSYLTQITDENDELVEHALRDPEDLGCRGPWTPVQVDLEGY